MTSIVQIGINANGIQIQTAPFTVNLKDFRMQQKEKVARDIVKQFKHHVLHQIDVKVEAALRDHYQEVQKTKEGGS